MIGNLSKMSSGVSVWKNACRICRHKKRNLSSWGCSAV